MCVYLLTDSNVPLLQTHAPGEERYDAQRSPAFLAPIRSPSASLLMPNSNIYAAPKRFASCPIYTQSRKYTESLCYHVLQENAHAPQKKCVSTDRLSVSLIAGIKRLHCGCHPRNETNIASLSTASSATCQVAALLTASLSPAASPAVSSTNLHSSPNSLPLASTAPPALGRGNRERAHATRYEEGTLAGQIQESQYGAIGRTSKRRRLHATK
jgi:hypothetical protein